jgi:hypothetical protein
MRSDIPAGWWRRGARGGAPSPFASRRGLGDDGAVLAARRYRDLAERCTGSVTIVVGRDELLALALHHSHRAAQQAAAQLRDASAARTGESL